MSDALHRALGPKSAMGKRKITRLLNSMAAGYLDADKCEKISNSTFKLDVQFLDQISAWRALRRRRRLAEAARIFRLDWLLVF